MTYTDLKKLEKIVNSELSSKILDSKILFDELMVEISFDKITDVIQFLKSDDKLKFFPQQIGWKERFLTCMALSLKTILILEEY